MKISQSVIDGIDDRLLKIVDNPLFYSERAILIDLELRTLADIHSFWLEHPELRQNLLFQNNVRTETGIRKKAKEGIGNIKKAWKYLIEELKESKLGVLGYMTPEIIEKTGKLVEPFQNSSGFRNCLIHSPFKYYTPKNYILIPDLIESLCKYIKANDSLSPVELAAEAHMRLAGIQAFREGNKRTARLFERRILEGYGLPTSYIPLGERQIYLDVLEQALEGLEKNKISLQIPFFDYIGGKVTTALDKIIDDLNI